MSCKYDPYKALGVTPDAPEEVIKAAHRALARKHHRDATGEADDAKMKRVNAAFEKIKDGKYLPPPEPEPEPEPESEPEELDEDEDEDEDEEGGVGCRGCLLMIIGFFLIWMLLFGVTVGGRHYGVGCNCSEGVVIDTGRVVDAGNGE